MARINIEESIFKDIRFSELVLKLGGQQNALGALVWAWIIAQPYWVLNQRGIPKPEWQKQKVRPELLEVGLALDDGEFYYVCGSKENFSWLIQAKINGKSGGLKSRRKKVSDPIATLEQPLSQPNPLTLSLSLIQKEERVERAIALPSLAIIWNQNRGPLPEIKGCSKSRDSLAKRRWKENPRELYWIEIIKRIVASDFCMGKNERGWKANFDFLMRPDTQYKVLEGQYDNKNKSAASLVLDEKEL